MKIVVINGPNLNLLGKREPSIYGDKSLEDLQSYLIKVALENKIEVDFFQSNIEGNIVDCIQQANESADGIILNAGAYTHTSVAIRDAVSAISVPVVEVHISNPLARESFRKISLLAEVTAGSISGFGFDSYLLALLWFSRKT
ncbi:MAG: type II 3-dehydroquinate dehydratase [Syntrophaceae bacterium]|mgnify:FL=1|nr:type II 3-dehydroquinate dehydratase [Syntrophaceae bacterium]